MNVFEQLSLFKEVSITEGRITLDKQRVALFPTNFIASYLIGLKDNSGESQKLYNSMKEGMRQFSVSLGKEYGLTSTDFLSRWVKYCTFTGWGIAEYKLLDENGRSGFLHVKGSPLHIELRRRGIKGPIDSLFEGLLAGSASGSFNTDIDVVETRCLCSGSDVCVYNWGSKKELDEKFPNIRPRGWGAIG